MTLRLLCARRLTPYILKLRPRCKAYSTNGANPDSVTVQTSALVFDQPFAKSQKIDIGTPFVRSSSRPLVVLRRYRPIKTPLGFALSVLLKKTLEGRWRTLLGLLAVVFSVLFATMPSWLYVGDAMSIRLSTIQLLTTGTTGIRSADPPFGARGQYFFEHPDGGIWHPKYGIANTVAYLPPLFLEKMWVGKLALNDGESWDRQAYLARCFFLNAYNILLALVIAGYLHALAMLYTDSPRAAAVFVLFSLFASVVWNYLRAQTVEVFQLLLFLVCVYHLFCSRIASDPESGVSRRHRIIAAVAVGCLCLGKTVYLFLYPPMFLYVVLTAGKKRVNMTALRAVAPTVVTACAFIVVMLLANFYRFGDPIESGYGQWEREQKYLTWDVFPGILGFMTDPQKSIFLAHPLLFLSVFGVRYFWKNFQLDFLFIFAVFLLALVVNSAFINWRGDWCFGPRYLVFVLPVLALPAIRLGTLSEQSAPGRFGTRIALMALFFWTLWTQTFVHSVEFFVPFRLKQAFSGVDVAEIDEYFRSPYWRVNRDYVLYRANARPFPPLELSRGRLSAPQLSRLSEQIERLPTTNLFWVATAKEN